MRRCGVRPLPGDSSAASSSCRNARAGFSPHAPSGALWHRAVSRPFRSLQTSTVAGTMASRLRTSDRASTGTVYGQGSGCSSTASRPTVMMRSAWLMSLRSICPPKMQPALKAWSSGMTPLHLVVVNTGAPSFSANATSSALALLHKVPSPTSSTGRFAALSSRRGAARLIASGLMSAVSGSSGALPMPPTASFMRSSAGMSSCTGPGACAVAVRMARRAWRWTASAFTDEFHLVMGA